MRITERTARTVGIEVPTTASNHVFVSNYRTNRIAYGAVWIGRIPIGRPLPNVSVHVVQSPGVRRKTSDRRRSLAVDSRCEGRVRESAVVVGLVRREARASGKRRRGSGSARVFPFRLGR